MPMLAGIQIGARTHVQLHSITPHSLRTMNVMPSSAVKLMPPPLLPFLSLLESSSLNINAP